jgi:hypothetical protein
VSPIEEAAQAVAESWQALAGPKLALAVAKGEMCDRCARAALLSIGVAAGVPPKALALCVLAYGETMRQLADRIAALLELDEETAA